MLVQSVNDSKSVQAIGRDIDRGQPPSAPNDSLIGPKDRAEIMNGPSVSNFKKNAQIVEIQKQHSISAKQSALSRSEVSSSNAAPGDQVVMLVPRNI